MKKIKASEVIYSFATSVIEANEAIGLMDKPVSLNEVEFSFAIAGEIDYGSIQEKDNFRGLSLMLQEKNPFSQKKDTSSEKISIKISLNAD